MDPGDPNSAVVTFNNQNSVLMAMYLRVPQILCLLHDNRIFAFQKYDGDSSSAEEQTLLLALLTTAKFRLMGFLYSGYHLVDNTLFLLIIILSIMNNGFTLPEHHEIALFAAIGLEGFYDVMLYTHRYWILQRLSIFIGIVLYILYFVIVGITAVTAGPDIHEKTHNISINVVWVVLGTRFLAFILQELVDIAIDMQLHNDLVKLNLEKGRRRDEAGRQDQSFQQPRNAQDLENGGGINDMQILVQRGQGCLAQAKKYLNVSNAVKMPEGVTYIGSMFAWGQQSVFDENVWKTIKFRPASSIALCFFPGIPAFLVFIPLFLLCCSAGLIILVLLLLVSVFTCRCTSLLKRTYWSELTHL